jgi:hypothetical protein
VETAAFSSQHFIDTVFDRGNGAARAGALGKTLTGCVLLG